jgi:hypothetical protein
LAKKVKRLILVLLVAALGIALFLPIQGEEFPDLLLQTPMSKEGRAYLGLAPAEKNFRLSDINADMLLIEAVNTMCIHCRESAKNVELLFNSINTQNAEVGIKTFSLFYHDEESAVMRSRKHFPSSYPRIADPMGMLAQSGNVVVPTLYVIRLNKDGGAHTLVHMKRGRLDTPGSMKWTVLLRNGENYFEALRSLAMGWWNSIINGAEA